MKLRLALACILLLASSCGDDDTTDLDTSSDVMATDASKPDSKDTKDLSDDGATGADTTTDIGKDATSDEGTGDGDEGKTPDEGGTTDGTDDADEPDEGGTVDGADDVDEPDEGGTTDGDTDGTDASPDAGPVVPQTETNCTDEVDDDQDGLTDCNDPDCQLDSECVPTCKAIAPLTCAQTLEGGNAGVGSTNVFAKYACDDSLFTGPEKAWAFKIDDPTFVTIALAGETDATDVLVIEDVDGQCFAKQCIAHGLASAAFLAVPNHTYFVVVDGYDGTSGEFSLSVACEACTPQCGGLACGDDGCGGSCGDCAADQVCAPDQKACISPPPNDTCGGAETVDKVPFTTFGDTTDALNDYAALGAGCVDAGISGGPDAVYSFTPESTSIFRIELNDLTFDAALYVVTDCDAAAKSCVEGQETLDDESLDVGLSAGQTYYIIVDGVDELETGSFTLNIANLGPCAPKCEGCGKPDGCGGICSCQAENDVCENATEIDPSKLPTTVTGSTAQADDDYAVLAGYCPDQKSAFGDGGADVVYSFTPTKTGEYTLLIPFGTGADFDTSLYIVTDCSELSDACVAAAEKTGLGGESLTLEMEADLTYFIIVDGYKDNQGTFSLTLGPKGSVGPCGGISLEGCCDKTELASCKEGGLETVQCGTQAGCGWDKSGNGGKGWYACGFKGADPTGKNPIACPSLLGGS